MPDTPNPTVPDDSTRLSAGKLAEYSLSLVPRTSLTLTPPDASISKALTDPGTLQVEVPIGGTCVNLPNGTKCQLYWLVKQGQQERAEGPLDATLSINAGAFEVKVGGATPKIDLVRHKIVGKGLLGCRVVPDFPHAKQAELAPGALTFDVPLGFELAKPSQLLVGAHVRFKPQVAKAFAPFIVELEIVDAADLASTSGVPDVAATHQWDPGNRDSWTWAIGFTDASCEVLGHLDANGAATYAFAWRLNLKSDKDHPGITLVENTSDFGSVPKPRLEQFGLEFGEHWYLHDVVAGGRISQLAPDASLDLAIALVEFKCIQQPQSQPWDKYAVRTTVGRDGSFTAGLRSRWFGATADIPSKDSVFAILTIPALQSKTVRWPITSVLALDGDRNPGFKDADVVYGQDADWACSAEISKLVKTSEQLLDDALVKAVLYCHGNIDPAVHEKLRQVLKGDLIVQRGQCDDGVAKALERAMIYLGYPTGSVGDYSIGGSWGPGANFGWALFLRENVPDLLQDKDGKPISEEQLIFPSGGNDTSKVKVASFPIVPVDKVRLQALVRAIDHTRRTKEVYLSSCEQAVDNLDRIEEHKYLNARGVVQHFRATIDKVVTYAKGKNVTIRPTWIAAFIMNESKGVPRPKYEHHVFYSYYVGKDGKGNKVTGGMVVTGKLQNFRDCRFRSTSFGLGQLLGMNFAETGAATAFDLFKAGEYDQVKMIADHLIAGTRDKERGAKITALLSSESPASANDPGVRAVSSFYNGGGFEANSYHVHLFNNFQEVKAAWTSSV